ncbi:MAG: hypothetical protein O7A04_04680 [Acidobacteria bacterium]|nr:hypothetical protein [Acidobacteriota bacterium]
MKRTSRSTTLVAVALTSALAYAAELETVNNPAAGFSISLPAGWTSVPLPTGLISSAAERNELGRPVVSFNVGQPDLGGNSFTAFREEQRTSAERRSKQGDLLVLIDLEHAAGPAFRLTRRTTTRDGLEQVVHAVYVEAGRTVWLLNWLVSPSDDPDRFEELALAVAASFRVE